MLRMYVLFFRIPVPFLTFYTKSKHVALLNLSNSVHNISSIELYHTDYRCELYEVQSCVEFCGKPFSSMWIISLLGEHLVAVDERMNLYIDRLSRLLRYIHSLHLHKETNSSV